MIFYLLIFSLFFVWLMAKKVFKNAPLSCLIRKTDWSQQIEIISGKTNWQGVCFRSDDALTPLVKTVSQPLSIKIESLTKELHKLKSENILNTLS